MDQQVVASQGDSLSDIQNYLVNFNKEICAGGQNYILTSSGQQKAVQNNLLVTNSGDQLYYDNVLPSGVDDGVATSEQAAEGAASKLKVDAVNTQQTLMNEEGVVFSTVSSLPSQQQTDTDELMTVQSADGVAVGSETDMGTQFNGAHLITIQPEQTAGSMKSSEQDQKHAVSVDANQQFISAEHSERSETNEEGQEQVGASNSYQTVTIVPSEVNHTGEVSYVLIVSQNDQQSKASQDGNGDMSVYDFKEENRDAASSNADDANRKSFRGMVKKQQVQAMAQLMCNYCNYTSPKKYLLTRHMKTHSEERPHKCHICTRGFKTVASLQNHINTHTGVHPHKCKECDAAFTTSGELVRHVRYRHTYEKPHKCPECDYASVELSKLKRHMRSHTGERPYQCPHCTYASPDTYKLKRHLRIHTGEKPYECDICHTHFTQSNSLKAHRLIHTGNKPVYQCELCPTTCSRKTDLKFHVQKLHTSDLPLQCKKCGKSFPDRYTWKIHLKTHEGEKCFKCELCPYAALSQRHLESHLLTHTGEKPFECDECNLSFRQKQLLRRHKNLYHNPDYVPPAPKDKIHECPDCGKAFAHKGNLLRHRAGHDPNNQEYQEALENYRAEQGEDYDEEAEEEEDEHDMSRQVIVTQAVDEDGQTYQTENTGQVHLANINGQQIQLQLVNLNDENNTQVYIQIDDNEQLEGLMDEQVSGEHHNEIPTVMEVETPTSHHNRVIKATRLNIKQEDLEQEDSQQTQGQTVSASQFVTVSRSIHSDETMANPAKRQRTESPRKSRTEQDEALKKKEWRKKDIETCFGFDNV